ncbi:protein-L-isoaspartate O-methyltransferase family protein [Ruania halotolerans]|uniref:protein-L-isoaspartate O-methyltransferase family protein n=1 Tax=Ruania halotolerans TaxID=2897773 RepID=UPI001E5A48F9|nr:methyltransferase domain-containing protein [Ruania halotolerans]UFU06824.1 methyltransferase domain-containing protein [Ruania halotolerans]
MASQIDSGDGAAIDRAFDAMPRTLFLPPEQQKDAGADLPLHLTEGQTCSQPSTVRSMLELLDVPQGAAVLDVGSGSGWTTALLAHLVGPSGRVDGVEVRPALVAAGRQNLRAAAVPWATIHRAHRDVLGRPEAGPYDRILVSATAPQIPAELLAQLADGGRMVLPVGTTMTVVERTAETFRSTPAGQYRFVPLVLPGD